MAAVPIAYVQPEILAQIVNGTYDKTLSEAEAGRIESVPENLRPWFHAVVEQFYLPLRGIVKNFRKSSPGASGTDFLDMLVEQLTQEGTSGQINGNYGNSKIRSTKTLIRASYRYKQGFSVGSFIGKKSTSVPFEGAADSAMADYLAAIKTRVENSAIYNSNFRFIGVGNLRDSLRVKILG